MNTSDKAAKVQTNYEHEKQTTKTIKINANMKIIITKNAVNVVNTFNKVNKGVEVLLYVVESLSQLRLRQRVIHVVSR